MVTPNPGTNQPSCITSSSRLSRLTASFDFFRLVAISQTTADTTSNTARITTAPNAMFVTFSQKTQSYFGISGVLPSAKNFIQAPLMQVDGQTMFSTTRSEERRVGKECRS